MKSYITIIDISGYEVQFNTQSFTYKNLHFTNYEIV